MRGVVFRLAIGVFATAAPAAADTLRLSNCTDRTPTVVTYDAGDGVCWVPVLSGGTKTLPKCGTVTFNCGGKCKVKVEGRSFDCGNALNAQSGEQIYTKSGFIAPKDYFGLGIVDTSGALEERWSKSCSCAKADMQW